VRTLIESIVEHEGPIHRIRLAKLVANAFGLERVQAARVASIFKCIPKELEARSDAAYLWPAKLDRQTWTGFRIGTPQTPRVIEHVHPREIANTMRALSQRNAGMYEDELRRETINQFGLVRQTSSVSDALSEGLTFGLQNDILRRDDAGLIVGAD
jgi:hypothetical protein